MGRIVDYNKGNQKVIPFIVFQSKFQMYQVIIFVFVFMSLFIISDIFSLYDNALNNALSKKCNSAIICL